jgi:hypothetical protein
MGLANLGEPATAGPAFEKAGEKVTRSACTLRSNAFVLSHDAVPGRPLTLLHQIPQFVINNSKVWDALDDPFSFPV